MKNQNISIIQILSQRGLQICQIQNAQELIIAQLKIISKDYIINLNGIFAYEIPKICNKIFEKQKLTDNSISIMNIEQNSNSSLKCITEITLSFI